MLSRIFYPPFLKRGITLTPWLILIPKWAKGNASYLAHELTHAEQQRKHSTLTFWWRYLTSKAHRQIYEVEAYKVQIAHGASPVTCALHLSSGYRLGITHSDALKLLEAA